ncbi:hypothetical protein GGTG_01847 [Gaeumannomyces tritici R3-111a-1]|uniref:Uncharacterized protein n=1 Tax=Gaeumannomyces tritici (strain R3-111a-1) TaxID=644352 RepID=J3NKQ6_GAET3|nr:hypothetical protein GGTG_01847 [Gaeumannomyces tritici R3-111a-1]EJT81873.1 hypothetical protein GGTG_01847 [Gaeumannomyces tritici R3-111a-1]
MEPIVTIPTLLLIYSDKVDLVLKENFLQAHQRAPALFTLAGKARAFVINCLQLRIINKSNVGIVAFFQSRASKISNGVFNKRKISLALLISLKKKAKNRFRCFIRRNCLVALKI